MFGYIKPDLPYLYLKDDKLYKSLYCSVCKSIKVTCGELARFTLTYDIAFLNAIIHNILGVDVEIKKGRCVAHPIKSRPIAKVDEISKKMACVNVLLAYYKTEDDIVDNGKGKYKKLVVNKGYKRAKKLCPEIDKIICENYTTLRRLEDGKDGVIDKVSDCFATMLEAISNEILGEKSTLSTKQLFYYIGKWIYLIDGLDDYDKDIKKGNYNPFYYAYLASSAKELLTKNSGDINFIFNDILENIAKNLRGVKFNFNKDLIENILLRGIPTRTNEIFKRILNDEK